MSIDELLASQAGVVSRRQVLGCGGDDVLIERRLRRREWRRVHLGVYVDHTGPLTWLQQLWAALSFYGEGAVAGDESVLRLAGLQAGGPQRVTTTDPGGAGGVHVAVDHRRRVTALPQVSLRRVRGLERFVHPVGRPPRLRLEHAVLLCASRQRSEDAAVAVLADACQSRRTTPGRLTTALGEHPRLPGRRLLAEVVTDLGTGSFSALERRYLRDVERAHGLPCAARQRRVLSARGSAYRDADYVGGRVVVELDGRLGHDVAAARWADLDRDLESAASGSVTVRVGWRQVLEPCRTATVVGRVLAAHGWRGALRPCGPACAVPTAESSTTGEPFRRRTPEILPDRGR